MVNNEISRWKWLFASAKECVFCLVRISIFKDINMSRFCFFKEAVLRGEKFNEREKLGNYFKRLDESREAVIVFQ